MTTTHDLKIWPEHFRDLLEGRKTMELRLDDRGFEAGDRLLLREWEPYSKAYTGRETERTVSLVTRAGTVPGLVPGFAILNLVEPDRARWGAFIARLAESLGVEEGWGGGLEEERLLQAVTELKALAGPEARGRFAQVRDLVQDAHATACLGSGAQARERLAEASVLLQQLAEGRA